MATSMDSISCSICLDPLKDPVAIPCGHSYCMGCIKDYWDQDYQKGVYSCPQCRQTFIPRPVLNTNTLLAELVESLKKTGQAAPLDHCYAGPGDVECDVCTGRKLKAVKSCLECLASYCETHLQPHYESPTFKKHKLVKASTQLQEKICSRHDKLLEMYCRTDQQIICYLCMIGDHKGHDTVSAESERVERQRQQGEKQRIQKIKKEIQEVRRSVKSLKRSAQAAVEESEKIFTELICTFERRCSEVKELIKAQEKAAVSQAEGLLKQLEQEIAKLRRRDAELEQLSHTEDHIHFLQTLQSLCVPPGSEALLSITVNQHVSFEDVKKSVSELKNQIEVICSGEIALISAKMTKVQIFPPVEPCCLTSFSTPQSELLVGELASCRNDATLQKIRPEPKTREEFLEYSCQLTLDPNTANNWLCLSEGNRKVTWSPWSNKAQPYPDHPDRFSSYEQVLCREGLSGTCYWEVEWSAFKAYIAISYKGIGRIGPGDECWFGGNDQSWSLVCCSILGCYFYHNNKRTATRVPRSSRIVGVYLDHRAGTLSFYSVSDTMTLLHRVQTTFNQPLYPGFWIYAGSSVKILNQ
ncbi:tripartite motif-containing protein 16 [Salmo salar]|uniref:Tripartite motif-containing protein 16 n=1 Tax=Salmo salar TaxID=8030 RepID=A0A1S3LNV0_SALSA|nr:tripartite motif-containing protein 16 [Salmo salar]|eukprot:XP_013992515.1 PREDICTED: tripartite motif-containing protein 16-like [Salmo salar]